MQALARTETGKVFVRSFESMAVVRHEGIKGLSRTLRQDDFLLRLWTQERHGALTEPCLNTTSLNAAQAASFLLRCHFEDPAPARVSAAVRRAAVCSTTAVPRVL